MGLYLGNGRVYFSNTDNNNTIDDADILQEQNYYAFGAVFDGPWYGTATAKNKYQYNSKELNTDLGLNLSDYGARWYDAAIGRWLAPDPLAEKYHSWSPYNYGMNNPIRFIDPDGMQTEDWVKGANGKVYFDASINNETDAKAKNVEYLGKDVDVVNKSTGQKYFGDNTGRLNPYNTEATVTASRIYNRYPSEYTPYMGPDVRAIGFDGPDVAVNGFFFKVALKTGIAFDHSGIALTGSFSGDIGLMSIDEGLSININKVAGMSVMTPMSDATPHDLSPLDGIDRTYSAQVPGIGVGYSYDVEKIGNKYYPDTKGFNTYSIGLGGKPGISTGVIGTKGLYFDWFKRNPVKGEYK
jgi:RHS repeat-associated protein